MHVHVVAPTEERPHRTLITSGMSELPMTVPEGHDISPYAELMLSLPADWPLTEVAGLGDETGWPLRILKQVARLPQEYGTWIGEWHSVPNGDPAQPYATDTPFAGVVVTPMLRVPPEARTIDVGGGIRIALLALIPLHPEEIAVKVERGTNAHRSPRPRPHHRVAGPAPALVRLTARPDALTKVTCALLPLIGAAFLSLSG
ncbi:suppressor of fused domain protein [Micromonospora chalcea]|uniref:suppressor of fused domain protein n=1 Tax=Micromonospora chalcea TaxID=1874 RepID=UPI003404C772